MTLSDVCIRRPVFATVICLILIIFGVLGYNNLSLKFLPNYQPNKVNILTNYEAGSAQYIEENITTPIEEQIAGVAGIDYVQSISMQGASMVTVQLKQSINYDEAVNDIRSRLELAKKLLPDDLITPPIVQRGYMNMPLMRLAFINPNMKLQSIRDYIERNVKDSLSQIDGVSSVQMYGASPYAMLIQLNPSKMNAVGVSVQQIQQAIQNSTEEKTAGILRGTNMDFPVNQKNKLQTAEQYRKIVLADRDGRVIHVGDVAKVELTGYELSPSIVRVDGKPAVTMQVLSTTDGNEIQTAHAIKKYLARLQSQMPPGMHVVLTSDMSKFMQGSIDEVYLSIAFAIACVVLMVYLFLGSVRTSLVPIMTIPICLVASFALMDWLGFSINMITLIALILSIGLVVDDAIVVLENIYRHLQSGLTPVKAALVGSKEITFSIIVMTLTLAAVYAPFGFITGMAAAFLKPFAFTLSGAVIISGLVSLSLSPMMCSKLLQHEEKPNAYMRWIESALARLAQGYRRWLAAILKMRVLIVVTTVLIAFAGVALIKTIPFEASPPEDVGFLFLAYRMAKNENVHHTVSQLKRLEQVVKKYSQVKTYISIAQSPNVFDFPSLVIVGLKDWGKRDKSSAQLTQSMEQKIQAMPGMNAYAQNVTGGGGGMHGIEFVLYSPDDYLTLQHDVSRILDTLGKYPGMNSLKSNVSFDTQEYDITVRRNLAAKQQVSVADINTVIATMIGGKKVANFTLGGKNYYAWTIASAAKRSNIDLLSELKVPNANGTLVPLSTLVQVKQQVSQSSLPHYNRQHAATITAQLNPGHDLGTTVRYLTKVLPQIMPPGMHYAFLGAAQDAVDSNSDIGLLFLLALVFIYLVMAAQFESFLDPLVILFSVPLCIVSALVGVKLFGATLNLYTNIALITLIGLIAKHGILITYFANSLSEDGRPIHEALIDAAVLRLRPILMTTATMVVGALPLLFAFGAGSNSRHQIGLVIVFGMTFGTFFSLVVVPVAYSLAHQLRAKVMRS